MLNEDVGIVVRAGDAGKATAISTIPRLLLHSATQYRKSDAFKFKRNGQWIEVSSDEFLLRVEELFFAIRALGVRAGDRVAIVSETRLEWAIADYATLCLGGITVPIYPTLSTQQMEALLRDSEPALVFVSTVGLWEKLAPMRDRLGIRYFVIFDPAVQPVDVLRISSLYDMGRQSTYDYPGEFRGQALCVEPPQVATIIYTSGTTGIPKGAMLTHQNLVSNIQATSERLPISKNDLALSFLPLSHIFQRHVDYASFYGGASIAYAENASTVGVDMSEVRPTFAAGVPRFFERIYTRTLGEVSSESSVVRAMFEKAVRIGKGAVRSGRRGIAYRAADLAIFRKIRAKLGGRIKFFISGGAALPKDIGEFFWAVGLPVYEGYGLTETSPVIALNGPGSTRIGSVGRPVSDQEVRIADDGEILVRGPSVMKGYNHMERETAEALAGGWFHTGDIGEVDLDGFLKITDRKKDLIITSNGKNIAPQAIENRLKLIPYFENVVVLGDHRHFISALIVPNLDALVVYARMHKMAFDKPAELLHKRAIYDFAMAEIDRHTEDLAAFEKVKKIAFLEKAFTIDGGELTPTLKIRRSMIENNYKSVIDKLYTL